MGRLYGTARTPALYDHALRTGLEDQCEILSVSQKARWENRITIKVRGVLEKRQYLST